MKYKHGRGSGYTSLSGHSGNGGKPSMTTREVAELFGINAITLRAALRNDPEAPKPTFVSRGLNNSPAYYWDETDRNKIALWWTNRQTKGAA